MTSSTANVDDYLGRAFILIAMGMIGSIPLAFVLIQIGVEINDAYFFIGQLLYNLVPTWYIWQSAKLLGKNPWIYGGIAIFGLAFAVIPLSILLIPRHLPIILHIFKRGKK
jgi:hypothetical protein